MISILSKAFRRPVDNVDVRATRLHERLRDVSAAIATVVPEQGALDRCLTNLLLTENPWADKENLANLTEVAARLGMAVELLSGFIGENGLVETDARHYSVAALERGIIPPVGKGCEDLAARERRRRRRVLR